MSFETGLQAFKQNKFESAIEALLAYCQECDDAGKVTSQKYMQAHMGIVKSYQALKQWDNAIAHCQTLTESPNHPLTIWVDRTLPKLQKAAAKGDEPDSPDKEEAKPKQDDNMMLLQQGMAAYKKMQCDRAIKLLEEYVNSATNVQSRNYMQAQMTLVKAYKETKAIQKAIALCNHLTSSENFALKSWASKALPKLKDLLGSDAIAEPSPDNETPAPQAQTAAPSESSTSAPSQPTASSPSSSLTFDASPNTPTAKASTSTNNAVRSESASPTSHTSRTSTKRSAPQRSSTSKRSPSSPETHSNRQSAASSKLINNSIAHSGIGMVGGAFGSVLGKFVLKRFVRAGVGLTFALLAVVFRGCFGLGSDVTPLQAAVSEGQLETVKTLVAKGKSLETPDTDGNTVLYWALVEDTCGVDTCEMSSQQQEIVDLLLDNGAKVAVANEWQETPLHFASSVNGAQEIIRDMLNRGADVNARDAVQMTPLHWAVTYGIDDNVEVLLNRGADMNAKDADGYTPLDFAFTDETVQLLKSRGAVSGQGG